MFVKRQIRIPVSEQVVIGPLLKAQLLQSCLDSEQILADAHSQALAIIESAQNQAGEILQEASLEAETMKAQAREEAERQVWDEANALITGLQQAEAQVWADVESSATQVLESVLGSVLSEISAQERIRMLVQRLVATQRQQKKGILYCSTDDRNLVADILEEQHLSFWQVEIDTGQQPGDLRLETDMGIFRCSWEVLRQAFVAS